MKNLMIGIAVAGGLLSTAALAAQSGGAPATEAMAQRPGDPDGDRVISRADYMARAAARFDAMDTNKDGKITAEERRAARPERGGWRRGGPGGPGGPGSAEMPPPPPPPGANGPGGHGPDMLARLDTDHDGKISRAEFNAPHDKHFDMLDANHDGQIDQTEIAAAHEKMRAMMQEMHGKWRGGHGGPGGDMPPPPPPPAGSPSGE